MCCRVRCCFFWCFVDSSSFEASGPSFVVVYVVDVDVFVSEFYVVVVFSMDGITHEMMYLFEAVWCTSLTFVVTGCSCFTILFGNMDWYVHLIVCLEQYWLFFSWFEFVCVSGVACGVDCVFACGGIDRASSGVLGFVCGDYECGGIGVHDMVWVSMVFVYLCDCYGMFTVYMDVGVSYLSYVHIRRSGRCDL